MPGGLHARRCHAFPCSSLTLGAQCTEEMHTFSGCGVDGRTDSSETQDGETGERVLDAVGQEETDTLSEPQSELS